MKKSVIITLFGLLFCIGNLDAQTSKQPDGSGTVSDPYKIETLDNLYWISQNSSSWASFFLQTADIDASQTTTWNNNTGWVPISQYTGSAGPYFTGVYDGGGHSITGLFINRPTDSKGVGLFGVISNGRIKNLSINADINGGHGIAGILAGMTAGFTYIENCSTSGKITGFYVSTEAGRGIGGLIGVAMNYLKAYTTIQNCFSSAKVTTDYRTAGGLVGRNSGIIQNCYSTGDVLSTFNQEDDIAIGGLAGLNQGFIKKCYSTGKISASNNIGGLVGISTNEGNYFDFAEIDSCYSTGDIMIIGIQARALAGGLVGFNHENSVIKNSFATGNVLGNISNSGGPFINGNENLGGLVGQNHNSTIETCYATGSVTGKGNLGGLVGSNGYSTINNCYARGKVNGSSNNVGGLVGRNAGNTGGINFTYSTGEVYSSGGFGGILGSNEDNGKIDHSFWDINTSGIQVGYGYMGSGYFNALGKSTSELKTSSTYTSYGWDFNQIWTIDENINDGYPSLKNLTSGFIDLNTGLIAYYPFNGNANDESGNRNNGTVNGAILTNDRFGNANSAYSFNGIDNWINCGNNPILSPEKQLTLTAWLKILGTTDDHQVIIAKWHYNDTYARSFVLELQPNGKTLQLPIAGISSDNISNAFSSLEFDFNEWNFVVGVYDGNSIKLYTNGILTGNLTSDGLISKDISPLFIGAHDCSWDRNPFKGIIDDIRIYNRSLSQSEIDALYSESPTEIRKPVVTATRISPNPTANGFYVDNFNKN